MGNMENIERRKQTTIQNGKLGKKPGWQQNKSCNLGSLSAHANANIEQHWGMFMFNFHHMYTCVQYYLTHYSNEGHFANLCPISHRYGNFCLHGS